MQGFSGRVSIVTGGGNGIGREICLQLAREGSNIACVDVDSVGAENTRSQVEKLGTTAISIRADVSSERDVQAMVDSTFAKFNRIDILVNNAGIGGRTGGLDSPDHAEIEKLTVDEWDRVMAVNLKSVFLTSKYTLPYMKNQKWGRIVSIASHVGRVGHAFGGSGPHYAVSKAGIINLTKTLAREYGAFGITVNAVSPGAVEGTAFLATMPESVKKVRLSAIPLGRFGTPKDIAHAVVFLAREESGYITGHTLDSNGGIVMY